MRSGPITAGEKLWQLNAGYGFDFQPGDSRNVRQNYGGGLREAGRSSVLGARPRLEERKTDRKGQYRSELTKEGSTEL